MKETENVSGMPEILTIKVHRSKDTGQYYMAFIEHTDTTVGNSGYWTNRYFTEEGTKELLKLCYPKWDGEHPPVCCTDDDVYENQWKMKDMFCAEYSCKLDCPHKGNGNMAMLAQELIVGEKHYPFLEA